MQTEEGEFAGANVSADQMRNQAAERAYDEDVESKERTSRGTSDTPTSTPLARLPKRTRAWTTARPTTS
jgi:hypothetical protein